MKLEHLTLTNFRGFASLEISFDPAFTVLLGGNMAGKSAVLDATAVAVGGLFDLGGYFGWWLGAKAAPSRNIDDDEVRVVVVDVAGVPDLQQQSPVEVSARAKVKDPLGQQREVSWTRTRDAVTTTLRELDHAQQATLVQLRDDLPVVAQYGTRRAWRHSGQAEPLRGVGSRYDGYAGCFDITSTHKLLASWMHKQTLVQLQRGGGYVQPQLKAVEAAVRSCVDGVTRFWYDVQYDELRLELVGGNLQSFAMLSEGVRNTLAMVADIAWRCAVLNPQHGADAHLRTEGVVLIDELDLHLHPKWQRRVVSDLRRTFPNIQFIVTTHSPQIVASVSRSQVRILDNNQLIGEQPHVEGRDANEILEDVFGVPPRPDDVRAEIDAIDQLIEAEKFADARRRLAELQQRLGPDDTAVVRARWLLDTEDPQPVDRAATPP